MSETPTAMSISTYLESDYAEFSQLASELYHHQFPHSLDYPLDHDEISKHRQQLLQIHKEKGVMLTLRADQKLRGFVCVQGPIEPGKATDPGDVSYVFLSDLFVENTYRNRGFGSALLHAAEDWAQQLGCHKIALKVMSENDAAMRFYQKNRFISRFTIMDRAIDSVKTPVKQML
ncbi:MAG: GNAT family N-acetyltransferase [Gammaproteobacteria bacterium]